MAIIKPVSRVL